MKVKGYLREDGSIGVRNHIAILPTIGCVNVVAQRIAMQVDGATPILHHQGCCQLPPDLDVVTKVLTGLGKNPNVKAVLLVSLGCESISAEDVKESINSGKLVEIVRLQEMGGLTKTVSKGVKIAQGMADDAKEDKRTEASLSNLTIGVKCGASDTTSGLASNPATGNAVDRLIEEGAKVLFGETTEVLGAEHILGNRGVNGKVKDKIYEKVEQMENRAEAFGVDMRGGQPTGGNIRGGLTTIEDKSLGAIVKSGTKPIQDVLEYGEIPQKPGLYFMDSPGREMEYLTGAVSAGSQIVLFSTGIGAPQGFPIAPVIKITGNKHTYRKLEEHMDINVSQIIEGEETIEETGKRIFDSVVAVASGEKVKAELLGYDETGVNNEIYVKGPTI